MKPNNLLKFVEWFYRYSHHATSVKSFFVAAYIHRYGKPANGTLTTLDKTIIEDALTKWERNRQFPLWVRDFWREVIIPTLLRKGGKE